MAGIDTKQRRSAALKDEDGMIFPTGSLNSAETRTIMLGDYVPNGTPAPAKTGTISLSKRATIARVIHGRMGR